MLFRRLLLLADAPQTSSHSLFHVRAVRHLNRVRRRAFVGGHAAIQLDWAQIRLIRGLVDLLLLERGLVDELGLANDVVHRLHCSLGFEVVLPAQPIDRASVYRRYVSVLSLLQLRVVLLADPSRCDGLCFHRFVSLEPTVLLLVDVFQNLLQAQLARPRIPLAHGRQVRQDYAVLLD